MPLKVLLVGVAGEVRRLLSDAIARDSRFVLVGATADPDQARRQIQDLNPALLTLDVQLAQMDSVAFLKEVMQVRPMPVVMVSSLTERGADITMRALELGAVDFVTRPCLPSGASRARVAREICDKLWSAAHVKVLVREVATGGQQATGQLKASAAATPARLIAIGASTGGTEAIARILERLPADTPAVVIAQHIPELFSAGFAKRLNDQSALAVSEARDGDAIVPGHAYVAPGNQHLTVRRSGTAYYCRLSHELPVNWHRPSVDVLFESVAHEVAHDAVGVILTGMGDDGARGLRRMRDAGSATIAQSKESSVVWGMPGEAVKREAAAEVLPLDQIAARLLCLVRR